MPVTLTENAARHVANYIAKRGRGMGLRLGVKTTGIFCRPVCSARKPLRKNVEFFPGKVEALHAGFPGRAARRQRAAFLREHRDPLTPGRLPEATTPKSSSPLQQFYFL